MIGEPAGPASPAGPFREEGERMVYEWDVKKARRTRLVKMTMICLAVTVTFVPLSILSLG